MPPPLHKPHDTWQDHALPAGTRITEHSLAGVLGCEREVSVPVGPAAVCCGDDGCSVVVDRDNSDTDGGSSSGSTGSLGEALLLVLKLRQVNGDGVMSGVGRDRVLISTVVLRFR